MHCVKIKVNEIFILVTRGLLLFIFCQLSFIVLHFVCMYILSIQIFSEKIPFLFLPEPRDFYCDKMSCFQPQELTEQRATDDATRAVSVVDRTDGSHGS